MKFCKISSIIVSVIILFSIVGSLEYSEKSDAVVPDGSERNPYVKNITAPVGGSQIIYISTNVTAFDYVNMGDGYSFIFEESMIAQSVPCILESKSARIEDSWPSESECTLVYSKLTVSVKKVDDAGLFAIIISPNVATHLSLKLDFIIKSYTQAQAVYYLFEITPVAESYEIVFDEPVIKSEGVFASKGTLWVNGKQISDLTGYKFYAKGLFRGISIHNDLTISGRIDSTDTRWDGESMPLTVVVSNIDGSAPKLVDCTINYTIDLTVADISFKIMNGEKKLLDNTNGNKNVSILAGTDLTLTVSNGTKASVIYDQNNSIKEYTLISSTISSDSRTLSTSGAGTYTIIFGQTAGDSVSQVQINVIASLVPTNNILITCGPSS